MAETCLRALPASAQMKLMRILHLCPSLTAGGAERQLCYLSRELGRRGHDIHIAVRDLGGPNINLLVGADNVHLYDLGNGRRILHGRRSLANYNPLVMTSVFGLVRRLCPDVIQTWIPQMDIIGGIVAKATGIPWILREPTSGLAYATGGLKVVLRARLGSTASMIVANSQVGAEYWGRVRSSTRRMIIRNGVPLTELHVRARLDHPEIPSDRPLILWAGRFDPPKNVERTFEAMVEAVSHSSAMAIICGDGPLRSSLDEIRSKTREASRVQIWPYQTQLWSLMKRADVFVSASYHEGSPNCVLEAMACRCPLVVSDIPAHREFLSTESAEFVDPHSAVSICQGIQKVLTNPALARARVERAYSDIAQFSVEKMADQYEALYRSL
jgi:glycosyltransferase involved in cell wall biosynthesis